MKRKTIILSLIGATALAGLGATAVVARGGEWCEGAPISRKTEAKLDRIESALKLQPGQQAAWDSFETQLKAEAKDLETAVHEWRAGAMPGTALGRLEHVQAGLARGQALVSTLTEATQTLYPTLNAEQQAGFDEEFRFERRHRRGGWHE